MAFHLPAVPRGATEPPGSRFLGFAFAGTVRTFLLRVSPSSPSAHPPPPPLVVLATRGQDACAPGDIPATKAALRAPAGRGRPQRPSMRPGECWGWPRAPGDARSLCSSCRPPWCPTARGTGFTGSSGRRGEGGWRRGHGLILVAVAGWRPGQASSKPLARPGGSPVSFSMKEVVHQSWGGCGNT